MSVRQMTREIIRPKHRQHAVRAMSQARRTVRHFTTLLAGTNVIRLN
ncbi:Uncharacterised protein [Shigella sonnei]|nr:Uncharacterised protein [Shigella sonnei]